MDKLALPATAHYVAPCGSGRQERGAADPLLVAAGESAGHFVNVPQPNDTRTTVRLLNQMGVTAARTETHRVEIDASTLTKPVAEYDLVKTMRASVLVLGPLVARWGEARVSLPGVCCHRPAAGRPAPEGHWRRWAPRSPPAATSNAAAPGGPPQGRAYRDGHGDVTGTENVMMAATADGVTVIENAAREPEVVDLPIA